jgi:hypothetical protein
MTSQENELALAQLTRAVHNIERLRVIVAIYIRDINGTTVTDREVYIAFSITERIYYNLIGAIPLLKDLCFNHNMATPTSHIFRGIIYEIILAYWLLEKDFVNRLAAINHDFVKKNYKRAENDPIATPDRLKSLLQGWYTIAPDNFNIDSQDHSLSIRADIKGFNFDNACKEMLAAGHDIKSLLSAYYILSQQAHFSSFSRQAIYDKSLAHIGIFDAVVRSSIQCCIYLISKSSDMPDIISKLKDLLTYYPPK